MVLLVLLAQLVHPVLVEVLDLQGLAVPQVVLVLLDLAAQLEQVELGVLAALQAVQALAVLQVHQVVQALLDLQDPLGLVVIAVQVAALVLPVLLVQVVLAEPQV
jgi:hypothetical protein